MFRSYFIQRQQKCTFDRNAWHNYLSENECNPTEVFNSISEGSSKKQDEYVKFYHLIFTRLQQSYDKAKELSALIAWLQFIEERPSAIYSAWYKDPKPNNQRQWLDALKALHLMCSLQLGIAKQSSLAVQGNSEQVWLNYLLDDIVDRKLLSNTITAEDLTTQLNALENLLAIIPELSFEFDKGAYWWQMVIRWFVALCNFLFSNKEKNLSDIEQALAFAKLTKRLITVCLAYHLDKASFLEKSLNDLINYCETYKKSLNTTEFVFLPPEESRYVPGSLHYENVLSSYFRYPFCIDTTLKQIDLSLEQIQLYGELSFHQSILQSLTGEVELSRYLGVYQDTRQKLESWSESVFAYRMACEKILHGTSHYIQALNYLDNALLQRQEQLQQIQQDWLTLLIIPEVKEGCCYASLIKNRGAHTYEVMSKAERCLLNLTEALLSVQGYLDWAEQAGYYTNIHEQRFKNEMQARENHSGKKFYASKDEQSNEQRQGYNLYSARTITDDAIDTLIELLPALRRRALKLHPDKNPQITIIANHALNTLDEYRTRASNITTIYQQSQFYKIVENPHVIDIAIKMPHPLLPAHGLTLASLKTHNQYLTHFKLEASLKKTPTGYQNPRYKIFETDDERFWIRILYEKALDEESDAIDRHRKIEQEIRNKKEDGLTVYTKKVYCWGIEFEAYAENFEYIMRLTKYFFNLKLQLLESGKQTISSKAQFISDILGYVSLHEDEIPLYKPILTEIIEQQIANTPSCKRFFVPEENATEEELSEESNPSVNFSM